MRLKPWLLGAWLATAAVYMAMILWTVPGIIKDAGGLTLFDMRLRGYSETEARAFLGALGPEGLALYTGPQKILDSLLPAVLSFALGLTIWMFGHGVLRWLGLLAALAAAGFDYLENALVQTILTVKPELVDTTLIESASLWTQLKFGGLLLEVLIAVWFVVRWRRQRN